ncbi:MAG TPA: ABC transporter permease [Xanthobacteraceae bacterium]|jgi:NitT/TauT family transport system permease protein
MSTLAQKFGSLMFMLLFFVVWEAGCYAFGVSELVLPRPSSILHALYLKGAAIWPHALATFTTTFVGFVAGVVAGVILGVVIGASKLVYDALYPTLVGFSSIPKVALVPILVLWFGAGAWPAILTAMSMSLFPVVVNVATGLATIEPELKEIMHVLKARPFDILWNISLPRSLPYLFASLKVAITLAFVGAVVSETVASNKGIGNMMMIASSNFDVPLTFAGLLVLAAMGVAFYAIFAVLERRFTRWAHRGAQA